MTSLFSAVQIKVLNTRLHVPRMLNNPSKIYRMATNSFLMKSYDGAYLHHDSVEETQQLYDGWAQSYDVDVKEFGYNAPVGCINTLEKWLPKDKQARVMDIACGTGMIGEEIMKRGYTDITIDGVDISEESVKLCENKKIYNRLLCDKVGANRLDIDDGMYDVVLTSGSFAPVHVTQDCFPELVRITKSGGLIIITMRQEYFEKGDGFDDGQLDGAIQALVQQGIWEELPRDSFEGFFGKHNGVTLVFKVLQNGQKELK